jgi:hypothetical protein
MWVGNMIIEANAAIMGGARTVGLPTNALAKREANKDARCTDDCSHRRKVAKNEDTDGGAGGGMAAFGVTRVVNTARTLN